MKKRLLILTIVSSLFSSVSCAQLAVSQSAPLTAPVNVAPPSFPTAGQAFKKIYSGDLSVADAQTQPWYESYDRLYKQNNGTQASDSSITALLTSLQQQTITSDAAFTQFQTAQTSLKASADQVFSS